jgi:hypothetical protein
MRSETIVELEISERLRDPQGTRQRQLRLSILAGFAASEFSTGRKRALRPHEAAPWNNLAGSMTIEDLYESGLRNLKKIV